MTDKKLKTRGIFNDTATISPNKRKII